jgi:hypothetical protein
MLMLDDTEPRRVLLASLALSLSLSLFVSSFDAQAHRLLCTGEYCSVVRRICHAHAMHAECFDTYLHKE